MAVSDQNARFLAHVKKLDGSARGFFAAHVHLSPLPTKTKNRDNISSAIKIFGDLKKKSPESNVFLLQNLDLVFIGGGVDRDELTKACESTLSVFGNYAARFDNPYGRQSDPYTVLDLDTEYDLLLRHAEKLAGIFTPASGSAGGEPSPRRAITMVGLAHLKSDLKTADMGTLLFNQPVYNIADTTKINTVFFETYVSIQALEEQWCDNQSVLSERWLFRSLTEDLDAAVLRTLCQPEHIKSQRRVSINLNLTTVIGPSFESFDNNMTVEHRARIVLEIGVADLFENMRSFKDVVKNLRRKGYKICIDGLSVDTALHIDFDGLDCDFAKLFWSNDVKTAPPASMEKLSQKIRGMGDVRFIMARCDNADSVRYARQLGIHIAQGRLIDQLVKKQIPV